MRGGCTLTHSLGIIPLRGQVIDHPSSFFSEHPASARLPRQASGRSTKETQPQIKVTMVLEGSIGLVP